MVRDLRAGEGDFSSRYQGTAVGVATSMSKGSQKDGGQTLLYKRLDLPHILNFVLVEG